jgi:hypothetical protein
VGTVGTGEDWAWLRPPADGEIKHGHQDYEYWEEAAQLPWPEDPDAAAAGKTMPTATMPELPRDVAVPTVALAVSREQAAVLLNISVDYLDERVIPDLRTVNIGRRVLIPVRELESWLENRAAFALKGR